MTGIKHDEGKDRWDLLPWKYIKRLVKTYTYGAKKYEDNNWQGLDKDRLKAGLLRHWTQYEEGKQIDDDPTSDNYNLAQVMWYCIALMYKDDQQCECAKICGLCKYDVLEGAEEPCFSCIAHVNWECEKHGK